MPYRPVLPTCLILTCVLAVSLSVTFAETPVAVEGIAPIPDVVFEINAQVEELSKALADEEGYEKARTGQAWQSFGLLAVLGQTLAEHDKARESGIHGPALRDAALQFKSTSSLEEARQALEAVRQVLAGNVTGEHEVHHPWNKLIDMDPMMEVINGRNSSILRVLRRPRGREDEPVHATTWALLAVAMKADIHKVKEEDLHHWNEYADEFRVASAKLAEAIRAQDRNEARKWFDKANAACDACHEKFNDF
jgi:cytochrome c556